MNTSEKSRLSPGDTLLAVAFASSMLPTEGHANFVSEPPDFSNSTISPTDLRGGGTPVDLGQIGDGVSGGILLESPDFDSADYLWVSAPVGIPVDLELTFDWDTGFSYDFTFNLVDGTNFFSSQLYTRTFPEQSTGSDTVLTTVTSTTGTIGIAASTNNEAFGRLDYGVQTVPEPSSALLLGIAAAAALARRALRGGASTSKKQ